MPALDHLFEDPEPRLLARIEHLIEASYGLPQSAAERSSCSRSAFSRSRIAASSTASRPAAPASLPKLLHDLVARLLIPAPRFLQVLEAPDERPVLRIVELQRILRLDERIGVEHPDDFAGRQVAGFASGAGLRCARRGLMSGATGSDS